MRWMTWRAMGLVDIVRNVVGCHLTQERRVPNALDDVAGNLCQALAQGNWRCGEEIRGWEGPRGAAQGDRRVDQGEVPPRGAGRRPDPG